MGVQNADVNSTAGSVRIPRWFAFVSLIVGAFFMGLPILFIFDRGGGMTRLSFLLGSAVIGSALLGLLRPDWPGVLSARLPVPLRVALVMAVVAAGLVVFFVMLSFAASFLI